MTIATYSVALSKTYCNLQDCLHTVRKITLPLIEMSNLNDSEQNFAGYTILIFNKSLK